jgi:hypothetical protein
MIKDNLMPATVFTCPPEGDEEAVERVSELGHPTLYGLTDTIFASVSQLADALKELGWQIETELVLAGGRKTASLLILRRSGLRYSILLVENARFARVEVVKLQTTPKELNHLKDMIEDTLDIEDDE